MKPEEITKKVIDTRLSYSSATLLSNCSQKYAYYKVLGVKKDDDADTDTKAFNVGKCFHHILEKLNHEGEPSQELVDESAKMFDVEADKALIHAMVFRYLKMHKASGLKCVAVELEISNDIFIGYVDAVMVAPDGTWYIVDLKTAARLSSTLAPRLHSDTQLNLYSSFKQVLAKQLKLKIKDFGGARYRVTTKSILKQKATESYGEYVKRLYASVEAHDILIPKQVMNPEKAYEKHKALFDKSMRLREGSEMPTQNFSYCDSFFKPCEYWSQCHGQTFTKCSSNVEITTSRHASKD